MDMDKIKRGDILLVSLPSDKMGGSVQGGTRYCIVVSNNLGNKYSTVLEVIPLTSSQTKRILPTHLWIEGFGLKKKSLVLAEQITTISKMRVIKKIGSIDDDRIIKEINKRICISLGL